VLYSGSYCRKVKTRVADRPDEGGPPVEICSPAGRGPPALPHDEEPVRRRTAPARRPAGLRPCFIAGRDVAIRRSFATRQGAPFNADSKYGPSGRRPSSRGPPGDQPACRYKRAAGPGESNLVDSRVAENATAWTGQRSRSTTRPCKSFPSPAAWPKTRGERVQCLCASRRIRPVFGRSRHEDNGQLAFAVTRLEPLSRTVSTVQASSFARVTTPRGRVG